MTTVTLIRPIKIDGIETTVLNFREPTLDDLVKMDQADGDVAKLRSLVASCANILEIEAGKISAKDLKKLSGLVESFFVRWGLTEKQRQNTIEVCFDVGYYWKWSRQEIMSMTISDLDLFSKHAVRINKIQNRQGI